MKSSGHSKGEKRLGNERECTAHKGGRAIGIRTLAQAAADKSIDPAVDALTSIWQRVLQRPCIGIDENFFDLGGDSSLALQLFAEIEQTCGRELPSILIYEAPTIRVLATLLERPDILRPPLVLLKPGPRLPPVFIIHGLSGTADFFELARQIRTNHPIYGIQARLPLKTGQPVVRVEDMARNNLDAIKSIQPNGPYALIGYCIGGLVALEMARCLSAEKENVALLALLETYPYHRYLSWSQQLRFMLRRVKSHISRMERLPLADTLSYCNRGFRNRLRLAMYSHQVPLDPSELSVKDRSYVAMQRYRPQFYPGKINFVRAEVSSFLPSDPIAVWGRLAAEIEVEAVPGDHLAMITANYQQLALILSQNLEQTLDRADRRNNG